MHSYNFESSSLSISNGYDSVFFKSDCQQVMNILLNNCMNENELET
jgi:hypothetical protein